MAVSAHPRPILAAHQVLASALSSPSAMSTVEGRMVRGDQAIANERIAVSAALLGHIDGVTPAQGALSTSRAGGDHSVPASVSR